MKITGLLASGTALAAVLVVPAYGQDGTVIAAGSEIEAQRPQQSTGIDMIVVTAQKREENVQDVPTGSIPECRRDTAFRHRGRRTG